LRHFALIHRISILAFVALAGVFLHPGSVSAVALGNIALQSSLGQPLRVVIPVALSAGETLNTSCLKLVRDPPGGTPQLLTGGVSVERNAASTRLIVTTPRAINEPALRLSVQAGCGGDTTRRDYVLLLDPQGTESNAVTASADLDQFRNYASTAGPVTSARRAQRVVASTAPSPSPAPSPTTFTPIDPPAPVAVARTQKTAPVAEVVALTAPPPEPVALITTRPSSGFIPEAAAASLSRMAMEGSNTNRLAASPPTALVHTRAEVPEATLWNQTWPYAAVLLSIGAIALTAFAKRRPLVVPEWGATTLIHGKSPMQTTGVANTFAHFAAMAEPAPIMLRANSLPIVTEEETYDASLDTLLQMPDVDVDGIDEHVIRKAWAAAATEGAADIGTDSILKAIAAAERDLYISPPEPPQAAIDKALDDDLMHDPKLHLSAKR
jgi:hypothetical protein